MARQIGTKNLNAQNATASLEIIEDFNGAVALWVSGTGTVILEFNTPRNTSAGAVPDEWQQIKMKNPVVGVNAEVDSLVAAAGVKYGYASAIGVNRVRARRTDSGTDDCFVSISFAKTSY